METIIDSETHNKSKADSPQKFLTFCLRSESYGVPVLHVREIIRVQSITVIPQVPDYIRGVFNLRGKVIPVIDLRKKFGMDTQADTDHTCIIVVQARLTNGDSRLVGIVVDAVEEVASITRSDIEETPDFGNNLSVAYISGMAKIKGAVTTLLDIDKVVGDSPIEEIGQ